MTPYQKPHLPIPDQVALLKSRGLEIADEAQAREALERIGYYRLSGYWYPMRRPAAGGKGRADDFLDGARFSDVMDLYVFDKRLRLLMLDAIELVEIGLRVDIALRLGARDPWLHRDPAALDRRFSKPDPRSGRTPHQTWLARMDEAVSRSREDFVQHFRARYTSELPIWIAIEIWDFGLLSHFLSHLPLGDRDALARKYGLPRPNLLTTTVRAINDVRNTCAHHGRLWNRVLVNHPSPPRLGETPRLDHLAAGPVNNRIYSVAAMLQLLTLTFNPTSTWSRRLSEHLGTFPDSPLLDLQATGFPKDWETLPLWT